MASTVTADRDRTTPYLADFETFAASLPAGEPGALRDLRRRAIERFATLGFPTSDWEEWRSTPIAPIVETDFARARGTGQVDRAALDRHRFGAGSCLVFVDGHFAPELSDLAALPEGVVVASLADALASTPERVERHLGRYASITEDGGAHPFLALNTAFFADGAYLELPRGAVVEEPIQLLFVASGTTVDGKPLVAYPRNLIVGGEHSQATVVETYAGLADDDRYFNCAVTELVVAESAVLDHSKVQKESSEAFHMATFQVYQERASNLFSHSIATGGRLVRNDSNAMLDGEGIECTLNGLYVLRGEQLVDNHMRMIHAKPHCNSYELFKGILDGSSRAVFSGRIYVAEGAQKTDAKQSNRNLLLSPKARANSNPQLEIFADDVRCTHGSTVGQLDEDAVFYLRSRGIGAEAAKSLLTYAFASDIVDRIKIEPVRRELTEFLFHRLPRGEVVRQAV